MRERSERSYGHHHDKVDNIPYCLQLPNLGTTLQNWVTDMKIDSNCRKERTRHELGQEFEKHEDFVHALQHDRSKMKCSSCFRIGREDHECNMTANFVHMQEYLKKNPSLEKQILADKDKFMAARAKPRPRKPKRGTDKVHAITEEQENETSTSDEEEQETSQTEYDDFSLSQVNSLRTQTGDSIPIDIDGYSGISADYTDTVLKTISKNWDEELKERQNQAKGDNEICHHLSINDTISGSNIFQPRWIMVLM